MSVHPSLSSRDKGKRSRSVLKRFERLKELLEKERWKPGNSVFALPKLKVLRWKIKKAKKAEAEVSGEATPETAAGEKATAAKGETPASKKESSDKK